MKSYPGYGNKQLQDIANYYRESGEPWPATARQIAEWAIKKKLWVPHPASLVDQLADMVGRAMREEHYIDPQGRSVRTKHAARVEIGGEQQTLWDDIRTGNREHMQIAFQQRRKQILGDCRQLKVDVDSYNDNTNTSAPIQMKFDFTQDLAEMEAVAALS